MRGDPNDHDDPKGLIRDAYGIEGISAPECRSIFLDWALSLPDDRPQGEAIAKLVERYGAQAPDHPMTAVLSEGQEGIAASGRRGGRAGRTRH
ncbi:hypothetical protein SAMN04490244_104277 [Tranquillimonas rosea]|uniref:Uncharacterized protein n=1 Tax=Tranquillimonas rosea TaxID=641238 RepID=A0A1H9TN59_9RHOB|nr:hypothetical protein [Tranquillimonas rosea]SER98497.1 hypothetical protein SAMN04490244_104277 [Tranquillimonas rosea]